MPRIAREGDDPDFALVVLVEIGVVVRRLAVEQMGLIYGSAPLFKVGIGNRLA
jgi:hypothetical protein